MEMTTRIAEMPVTDQHNAYIRIEISNPRKKRTLTRIYQIPEDDLQLFENLRRRRKELDDAVRRSEQEERDAPYLIALGDYKRAAERAGLFTDMLIRKLALAVSRSLEDEVSEVV